MNLELMTARVRFSMKNAPPMTKGKKYMEIIIFTNSISISGHHITPTFKRDGRYGRYGLDHYLKRVNQVIRVRRFIIGVII